jgi:superfamily II DNA or RNA helicase
MGRVMRGHEGKDYAVWLDHSGNYLRFQEEWEQIYETGVQQLDDTKEKTKKEKTDKEKEASKCPKCGAFWPVGSDTCLHCGYVRQRQNQVLNVSGEMHELVKGISRNEKQDWWSMCQYKVKYSGWSAGRAAHTYKDKYGVWPRGLVDVPKAPDIVFDRTVKAALIKFIKGKR